LVDAEGGFYREGTELLGRAPWLSMSPQHRIDLGDVTVSVTQRDQQGRATQARVEFAQPWHSQAHRWVHWTGRSLAAFPLPPVGEAVTLPGRRLPLVSIMLGQSEAPGQSR
jgi:hypothetical protein